MYKKIKNNHNYYLHTYFLTYNSNKRTRSIHTPIHITIYEAHKRKADDKLSNNDGRRQVKSNIPAGIHTYIHTFVCILPINEP